MGITAHRGSTGRIRLPDGPAAQNYNFILSTGSRPAGLPGSGYGLPRDFLISEQWEKTGKGSAGRIRESRRAIINAASSISSDSDLSPDRKEEKLRALGSLPGRMLVRDISPLAAGSGTASAIPCGITTGKKPDGSWKNDPRRLGVN